MGRWMARAGGELLGEADMLVPVPLHWRRGWSRRYNQSGALARVIAQANRRYGRVGRAAARPADPAAGRAVAAERASNVQGAFRVAPDRKADVGRPPWC